MIDEQKLVQLEDVLTTMLEANINISATGAVKHALSPYKHASDITRNPARAGLLKKYTDKQAELRRVMEQADKLSRTNLIRKIADLENKNAQLQTQRDILIASHKAMLLAVGEMGGMAAWHRFFAPWQETIDALKAMEAMPNATVLPLPPNGRRRSE
jgi:hypothetical protein